MKLRGPGKDTVNFQFVFVEFINLTGKPQSQIQKTNMTAGEYIYITYI